MKSKPGTGLPAFDVVVDSAAPMGNVLRPLAQLLLQVARRRLAESQGEKPQNDAKLTVGRPR
jgi:hypothetical protein